MTPEQQAMLATMYQSDDPPATPTTNTSSPTRRIKVGIIEYEVPTIEYVRQLEQKLDRHSRLLDQQARMIDRLGELLSRATTSQRGQGITISNLRHELSQKAHDY